MLLLFFDLQVRIRAWDSAYPDNYVEGDLTINVRRNINRPQFAINNVDFNLDDTFPSGEIVYNLTATDLDNVRLTMLFSCL